MFPNICLFGKWLEITISIHPFQTCSLEFGVSLGGTYGSYLLLHLGPQRPQTPGDSVIVIFPRSQADHKQFLETSGTFDG